MIRALFGVCSYLLWSQRGTVWSRRAQHGAGTTVCFHFYMVVRFHFYMVVRFHFYMVPQVR